MLHRQCKLNGASKFQTSKLLAVRCWCWALRLSCSLHAKSYVRKFMHCDSSTTKIMKVWERARGVCSNVNIGNLRLFLEMLFLWNIDVHDLSYSFIFKQSIFQVNLFWAVSVRRPLAEKVFGNKLHYWVFKQHWGKYQMENVTLVSSKFLHEWDIHVCR